MLDLRRFGMVDDPMFNLWWSGMVDDPDVGPPTLVDGHAVETMPGVDWVVTCSRDVGHVTDILEDYALTVYSDSSIMNLNMNIYPLYPGMVWTIYAT